MEPGVKERIAFADGGGTVLERWGTRGPKILCLHGMVSTREVWLRFAERFAQTCQVYAYDQRGHGDAPYDGGAVTLDRMLSDFGAIAAALGQIDLLVGASLGGALALAAGRRYSVGRVVTADPFFHSQAGDWGRRQLAEIHALQALPPSELAAQICRSTPWSDALDIEARVRAIETLSAAWVERFLLDNRVDAAGWDLRDELRQYPCPLLIVIAGVGSLIPVDDRRRLGELAGPNLSSHTLEGHGHSPHRSGLEPFAGLAGSFLKEARAQKATP